MSTGVLESQNTFVSSYERRPEISNEYSEGLVHLEERLQQIENFAISKSGSNPLTGNRLVLEELKKQALDGNMFELILNSELNQLNVLADVYKPIEP